MLILFAGLVLFILTMTVVCALALVLGGRTERHVAVGYLAASAATMFVSSYGTRWHGPNWGVMIVDALWLVALVVIARHSAKAWPIWAAAGQLCGLLAHGPAILDRISAETYVLSQPFWAFPILAFMLVGTVEEARARKARAPNR